MTKGPARQYTRTDVLNAMKSGDDPREPWTSTEIADMLGCSRELAYNRLRELHTLGRINTKKISSRGRVWWLAAADESEATTPNPVSSD